MLISSMLVNEISTENDLEEIKICQELDRKMIDIENIIRE